MSTDTALVVIDYWKDNEEGLLHKLIADNSAAETPKQLYFLVSHFHEDHYNPEILEFPDARLIVSYDAAKRRRMPKQRLNAVLRPDDVFEDECLKINAMHSTDVGVSLLITLPDGTTLYHAGDNNNWYFPEDPEEHIRCSIDEMEGLYFATLRNVKSLSPKVDHVMFPIDPRLGSETLRGVCQWLMYVKTVRLYPMHCWDRWDEVRDAVTQLRELFPEVEFVMP